MNPDAPARIQLRRTKGWRMPPNTVRVDRATIWGNPFHIGPRCTPEQAVAAFRRAVDDLYDGRASALDFFRSNVPALRGKNLACWCALDSPCHADVLLELANR
jgi:hypothetical protein